MCLASSCFDDLGKMLSLSRSTELMAPFYPLLLDGVPLAESLDVVNISSSVAAWSGVRNSSTLLLAVTPAQPGTSVRFELQLAAGSSAHTCRNLETQTAVAMQQTSKGTWTCDAVVHATCAFVVV